MEDSAIKYAVVRADSSTKNFTVWHNSLSEAKAEAERLANSTRSVFYVIQTTGFMRPKELPIDWVECSQSVSKIDF